VYINIAEQVRKVRILRGLSQADLGALLGTTQSRVSQMENPDYQRLSFNSVAKVAEVLNCDLVITLVPHVERKRVEPTLETAELLGRRRYMSNIS